MFYDPDRESHGLPFNPLKACVVPRPIGWITTRKRNGRSNVAPFSQFNLVGFEPGYVMFSANTHPPDFDSKHSVQNAERTGEFVYNMATWELRQEVVESSYLMDEDIDDIEQLGLHAAESRKVGVPRIAEAPVALECVHYSTLTLPGSTPDTSHRLVVGRVVGVHISDDALTADGRLDIARLQPLARLGYADYSRVTEIFKVDRLSEDRGGKLNLKMQGGA